MPTVNTTRQLRQLRQLRQFVEQPIKVLPPHWEKYRYLVMSGNGDGGCIPLDELWMPLGYPSILDAEAHIRAEERLQKKLAAETWPQVILRTGIYDTKTKKVY